MEGYILLHKKMQKWQWYQDSQTVHLFLHLLLSASFENKNWKGIEIKRGQAVSGLTSLKENTGISVQSLRTCLDRLKSTGEITVKSTNKFSIITIVKYNDYQLRPKISTGKSTGKLTNDQQTTNKQLTTSNKDNKVNNINNITKVIEPKEFGNPEINLAMDFFKKELGGSLDGSVAENRKFAKMLINKLNKDYPNFNSQEQIEFLITSGLQDKFHSKNITSFKYLFYNAQKIIQSVRSSKKESRFIDLSNL